ncbi:MAG: transposase [Sulfurimonas sp.]|nr:transposase [Sulfurimonas sp.]
MTKKVEEALYVNLLFMKFVGLSLEDLAPDSTTIGRFRNSLIDTKIYDKLFNHVNKQLEDKGLIAKSGKSILVDATLIKSLNDGVKDKDKEQRNANRVKVEEANRTLDLQINEELKKAKPSRKKVDKLLRKKEHNSRTFKNQELDELQGIDTKDIETSKIL